jgi:hypothetical protein
VTEARPRRLRHPAGRPAPRPAPSWPAVTIASAKVELRRWVRQPLAVATALVAPVAVAALISVALGGEPTIRATVAVVDLDGGAAGASFVDDALGDPQVADLLDVRRVATRGAAEQMVADGAVTAGIVLPRGLTAGTTDGRTGTSVGIEVLRPAEPSLGADLAAMVVDVYEIRRRAASVALATTGAVLPPDDGLPVTPVAPGGQALDPATHFGPAIGLFFVVLALASAVDGHVEDRRRGIVDRVAATPASGAALTAGRSAAAVAVGGVSLAVTAASMQLAFGRSWGPAGSVAGLVVAAAFALAGLAAVVAALVRSPGQAQGASVTLAFVMALASGTFTPPGAAVSRPALAELAPTTMALDGFALASTENAGVTELAAALGGLAAVGLLGFLITGLLEMRAGR